MRCATVSAVALCFCVGSSAAGLTDSRGATGGQAATQSLGGLAIGVSGVERAASASLADCPPGANTVKAMTKPGEEFIIVMLIGKVSSDYKPGPLKRPVLTDESGKTYNTAASFVDIGKTPEFICGFPFRVPAETKLKSLQIESLSFDLTKVAEKNP